MIRFRIEIQYRQKEKLESKKRICKNVFILEIIDVGFA
jgi:hypothetical protein